jgi:hypothetical protein
MNRLKSFKKQLLLEAVDLSTGKSIITSMKRGQIPFVGYKKFFYGNETLTKEVVEVLDTIVIPQVKSITNNDNFNVYLIAVLRKYRTAENLVKLTSGSSISNLLDALVAYYSNVNKREAKQDLKIKKRFEEFISSPLNNAKDKSFEQWANSAFAHKAKAREEDYIELYNKNGWEVVKILTFAAAKKFAWMGDKKAKWCTAANVGLYDSYTEQGTNPLYIIRNHRTGSMFQMDFGAERGPNFKDSKDASVNAKVVEDSIPLEVLNSIKDKKGKRLGDYFENSLKKDDIELSKDKGTQKEEGRWTITQFDKVSDFKKEVGIYEKPNLVFEALKNIPMEDLIKKDGGSSTVAEKRIESIGKITDGKKTYYYIIPVSEITFWYKAKSKTVGKVLLEVMGNKLVLKTLKSFLSMDLPKSIKRKLTEFNIGDDNKEEANVNTKSTKIGDIIIYEGVDSIKGFSNIKEERIQNALKKFFMLKGEEKRIEDLHMVISYGKDLVVVFKSGETRCTDIWSLGSPFEVGGNDGDRYEFLKFMKEKKMWRLNKFDDTMLKNLSKDKGIADFKDFGEFKLMAIKKYNNFDRLIKVPEENLEMMRRITGRNSLHSLVSIYDFIIAYSNKDKREGASKYFSRKINFSSEEEMPLSISREELARRLKEAATLTYNFQVSDYSFKPKMGHARSVEEIEKKKARVAFEMINELI